jgi:hypothetical protein
MVFTVVHAGGHVVHAVIHAGMRVVVAARHGAGHSGSAQGLAEQERGEQKRDESH